MAQAKTCGKQGETVPFDRKTVIVVHKVTGERRELAVLRVYSREIELRWPMHGSVRFYCIAGTCVTKDVRDWQICPVSLAALHKAIKHNPLPFGPDAEPTSGQQRISS